MAVLHCPATASADTVREVVFSAAGLVGETATFHPEESAGNKKDRLIQASFP